MNGSNLFVVMGVSGCGKSSVAHALALRTDGIFYDGDDFHPPANKAKMSAGLPLNDEDRWPWLSTLNRVLQSRAEGQKLVFLACSALREIYRERLSAGLPGMRFIYLKGSWALIRNRMDARTEHFMPPELLASQFATLEEPQDAIVMPISDPLPMVVDQVLARIAG